MSNPKTVVYAAWCGRSLAGVFTDRETAAQCVEMFGESGFGNAVELVVVNDIAAYLQGGNKPYGVSCVQDPDGEKKLCADLEYWPFTPHAGWTVPYEKRMSQSVPSVICFLWASSEDAAIREAHRWYVTILRHPEWREMEAIPFDMIERAMQERK